MGSSPLIDIEKLEAETGFEEIWRVYSRTNRVLDEDAMDILKQTFMAGAMGGIAVVANRIARLPGAVEPAVIMQETAKTIASALVELEVINSRMDGQPVGTA